MNFHGVTPEVVIQGRIPVMTSEYCPLGDLDFCVREKEQDRVFLKDRKCKYYPIIKNPEKCQSVILSQKETDLCRKKDDLRKAGVSRFRIYVE